MKRDWNPIQLEREIRQELEKVRSIGLKEGKRTGFCIGNTTKKIDQDYFFTPIRNTAICVCGSIIIDQVAIAEVVARTLDGEVDYLFVDTEKKISRQMYGPSDVGNVERAVRTFATRSKILTYKGNDLTVDAIDCYLAQIIASDIRGIGGKKVAIIGAGNIGFKLALRLTERGCHVVMVRRNTEILGTIVQALNCIKPRSTIAEILGTSDIGEALINADIVIGLTPGTHDITAEMIAQVKPNAVFVDAGKGSFSLGAVAEARRRGISIYRVSVEASFEGQVAMLLKMVEILDNGTGRQRLEGIFVVSGGVLGEKGDLVVDNIFHPKQIFGVADGCGDFIRDLSEEEHRNITLLNQIIQGKVFKGV